MKPKESQHASFALNPAWAPLLILGGGVDLSKGCPLMFMNQADTNSSDDAPQFEHVTTF